MSSVSSLYRRYLLVCSQWSIDTTKSGRDFGHHLRKRISELFPNCELTQLKANDLKALEQQIESLERLNKNTYFRPTFQETSASGMTADDCKKIISTENLKTLEDIYESSTLDRIKQKFGSIRFIRSDRNKD